MAAVMSPAIASGRVGLTFDWASSFCQVRLPSRDVAEALDEDVTGSEHIREFADFLGVGYGLVERLVEVVGAEDREVGVC